MAKKKPATPLKNVEDYRHKASKRKNNPPAKMAAEGTVPVLPKIEYSYSPRRPPVLRFDGTGAADRLPEFLAEATRRKLTAEEAKLLTEALRTHEPWLEWAGKRETQAAGFAVDPVALHIHERVSSQAILKVAARQDVQRDLFADPEQEYHEAVQFYRHDIDWTNRLILGDSMQVMASLARREDLAGKVQMIFIDPPYGIKYPSNFQPEIGKRDVKDKESDLTRELEMVKAYRDTWHIGIHSYLSYLRARLIVARELLADTGSVIVQISDENLHRVRDLMDEIFGPGNYCCVIPFAKTSGATPTLLATVCDYLLWYAKDKQRVKYRQVFESKSAISNPTERYVCVETESGQIIDLSVDQKSGKKPIPEGRLLRLRPTDSQGASDDSKQAIVCHGKTLFPPHGRHWSVKSKDIQNRVVRAEIAYPVGNTLTWKSYREKTNFTPITNDWLDLKISGFGEEKVYAVQTASVVIQLCILMTTDPGDLVLDPTGGSGTTASVAEQWGRRWIAIDTSRVAVAIARQRLLTAKYDYHKLRSATPDELSANPNNTWLTDPIGDINGPCTFACKEVPHVTLKSIAQNQNLDPLLARHEPILTEKLAACNAALPKVTAEQRRKLALKLRDKERDEGKRAVTDADRRRWNLPEKGQKWEHWTVPFDTDPDWPKDLVQAVTAYRQAWRAKMDEVNACIAANAEQEELVDQPEIARGVVRVSGPFTVEAVQPPELSLGDVVGFAGAPEEVGGTFAIRPVDRKNEFEVQNVEAYLDQMVKLLRMDGVRFPNNKEMAFSRLQRIADSSGIHAEGRWMPKGETDTDAEGEAKVGVVFGPQYGPFTVQMLENLIKPAKRRYDVLVIAAFNFTAEVGDVAENHQIKDFRIHVAHIRPDVNPGMAGLLKEQPGSQLFTVFGQPRTVLKGPDKQGEYTVIMEGVDIYDPVTNTIRSTEDQKVAAWFLDGDYDGRCFCITQAFFPDKSAWEKLAKALGGVVDPHRFEAFSGTVSLPFPGGKHKCVAVKVIDPRGNEVMQVHRLS